MTNARRARQDSRLPQLKEHAIEPVGPFADLLEKQHQALRRIRRPPGLPIVARSCSTVAQQHALRFARPDDFKAGREERRPPAGTANRIQKRTPRWYRACLTAQAFVEDRPVKRNDAALNRQEDDDRRTRSLNR